MFVQHYDMVVIGGGISGLSMAHYCARGGQKTLVLEREKRAGGIFEACNFNGHSQGFWVEMGAHTCYNSYTNLLGIIETCQAVKHLIPREKVGFKFFVDHHVASIPSQLHYLELLVSAPRILTLEKKEKSVEQYYGKLVGRRNFEDVFAPAFDAVICQPASEFPADVLFKKRTRRKDILKSFTLQNGLQTITDAMVAKSGFQLEVEADVRQIVREGNGFAVTTADGRQFVARNLTLASPVAVTAGLVREIMPKLSEKLASINSVLVETTAVAVSKETTPLPPCAGVIASHGSFYSLVSRDVVPNDVYRGFAFHFKPGAASDGQKVDCISEVLGIRPDGIKHMYSKHNRLPSLKVGHHQLVEEIDRQLSGQRVFLTGNYFAGLAIEDCVSRSFAEYQRFAGVNGH